MYADDVLIYSFRELGLIEDCVIRLNEDLLSIQRWADSNKLNLNPAKTLSMLCSRGHVNCRGFPNVVLSGQVIQYVNKVKYLGFQINNKLTCCDAISEAIRRIYFALRSLRSSSHFLTSEMKKHLIKTLVLPFFTFNYSVYPVLDFECKRKLNVAFNDCLRFIHNKRRYVSVSHIQTSILGISLENYLRYRNIINLYNIIHSRSPEYLGEMLQFAQSQRGLRLILPRFTHTIGERSFFVAVVRLWNTLPIELQRITSPTTFKNKIFLYFST